MTTLSTIAFALALALGTGCGGPASQGTGPSNQATPTGDGLQLTWRPPAVGSHRTVNDTLITAFTLTMPDGKSVAGTATKERVYHVEVIEAGEFVTKVAVHYQTAQEVGNVGGQQQGEVAPVQGNQYVVWLDGGAIQATTPEGLAVSPAELEALAGEFDDELGRTPKMAALIASKVWKLGEAVTLTADELIAFSEGDQDMRAESATITLVASDAGRATFNVDLVTLRQDGQVDMKIPMTMTAIVDSTNLQPLDLKMTGTMAGTAAGMPMQGSIDGHKTSVMQ